MKAVILAGGLGTRLSEETQVKPKPMVIIGKDPILWHIIRIFALYNIDEFIICCGYKSEFIEDYFINKLPIKGKKISRSHKGDIILELQGDLKIKIILAKTGKETPTAGRLLRIRDYLKNSSEFLMTYGDGLADIDINKLINHHSIQNKLVTVTAVHPPPRWGSLVIKGNDVIDIHEKFSNQGDRINGGFFVISIEALDFIENENFHWEREPLRKLAISNQLSAFIHDGFWYPMDTLREKDYLNQLVNEKKATWIKW